MESPRHWGGASASSESESPRRTSLAPSPRRAPLSPSPRGIPPTASPRTRLLQPGERFHPSPRQRASSPPKPAATTAAASSQSSSPRLKQSSPKMVALRLGQGETQRELSELTILEGGGEAHAQPLMRSQAGEQGPYPAHTQTTSREAAPGGGGGGHVATAGVQDAAQQQGMSFCCMRACRKCDGVWCRLPLFLFASLTVLRLPRSVVGWWLWMWVWVWVCLGLGSEECCWCMGMGLGSVWVCVSRSP